MPIAYIGLESHDLIITGKYTYDVGVAGLSPGGCFVAKYNKYSKRHFPVTWVLTSFSSHSLFWSVNSICVLKLYIATFLFSPNIIQLP